jgi:hypothetical protein
VRDTYAVIPPEAVQPGDTYKFQPANGGPPIYAAVIAVEHTCPTAGAGGAGLVHIQRNGGPGVWTYIRPAVGVVSFGRVVNGKS